MKSLSPKDLKKIFIRLQKSHPDFSNLFQRQNDAGNSPLHLAVEYGSIDLEKLLISYNHGLLSSRNQKQETPLDISLRVGKDTQAAFLLSQTPSELYPQQFLSQIIDSNMHQLLGQLFITMNDGNVPMKGNVPLMGYSLSGTSFAAVKSRLSGYNSVDETIGLPYIHYCITKGKIDILKVFLLISDIDLLLQDREGNTILNLSLDSKHYNPDIVHLILDWLFSRKHFSDREPRSLVKQFRLRQNPEKFVLWSTYVTGIINRQNGKGISPLIQVFYSSLVLGVKMLECYIKQLIDLGADVTTYDAHGNTPLFYAAYQGNIKAVELLRMAGASSTVTNREGITPVEIALKKEDEELINALTVDPAIFKK